MMTTMAAGAQTTEVRCYRRRPRCFGVGWWRWDDRGAKRDVCVETAWPGVVMLVSLQIWFTLVETVTVLVVYEIVNV